MTLWLNVVTLFISSMLYVVLIFPIKWIKGETTGSFAFFLFSWGKVFNPLSLVFICISDAMLIFQIWKNFQDYFGVECVWMQFKFADDAPVSNIMPIWVSCVSFVMDFGWVFCFVFLKKNILTIEYLEVVFLTRDNIQKISTLSWQSNKPFLHANSVSNCRPPPPRPKVT